jgi:hypothetical protein
MRNYHDELVSVCPLLRCTEFLRVYLIQFFGSLPAASMRKLLHSCTVESD